MSKISELEDGGSIQASDYLIVVRSGGNLKVRMNQITVDQVNLGDNEFIRLGNSQDLTLVHDASNSIINQAGIGDLLIQKAGSTKLTVNSTGVDITGTLVSDGLTVDGATRINDSEFFIADNNTGTTAKLSMDIDTTNGARIRTTVNGATSIQPLGIYTGSTLRQKIDTNGDISFYDDTGVSQSFFWDASAESLGIGNSNPQNKLDIEQSAAVSARLLATGATSSSLKLEVKGGATQLTTTEILANSSGAMTFATGTTSSTERMRIDSSGNVGIGEDTPLQALHVNSGTGNSAAIFESTDSTSQIWIKDSASSSTYQTGIACFGDNLLFNNGGEKMRIDASGNLLVGKTSVGSSFVGSELNPTGYVVTTCVSDFCGYFNRTTTDGGILQFRKDNLAVGGIGVNAGSFGIGQSNTGLGFYHSDRIVFPATNVGAAQDNQIDLGYTTIRWQDIYATNGTIQTSDRNEKQDIETLSDAEQRVAVAAKGLLRKFRWKSSVAEKGDEARTHFGIIAQDLQAAFEAEGLDAGRYAMFINSTWTDEETGEERNRMGVRYSELLAFIIAAI